MAIEASIASTVTSAIRSVADSRLTSEAWNKVGTLVREVDEAIEADDSPRVADLAAELDEVRSVAELSATRLPTSVARPAQGRPGAHRRRTGVVIVLISMATVGLAAVGSIIASDADDAGRAATERPTASYTDDATEPPAPDVADTDNAPSPTSLGGDVSEEEIVLTSSGELEIILAWTGLADLDLGVIEPNGSVIDASRTGSSPTGARHTGDANPECRDTGGRETVTWPSGGAHPGSYDIVIRGFAVINCGSGDYRLTIRSGREGSVTYGSVTDSETDTVHLEALLSGASGASSTVSSTSTATALSTDRNEREPSGAARSADRSMDGGDFAIGAVIGVAVALLAAIVAFAVLKNRRSQVDTPPKPPITPPDTHPRLPVPAEVRELANHTIHRLGVDLG